VNRWAKGIIARRLCGSLGPISGRDPATADYESRFGVVQFVALCRRRIAAVAPPSLRSWTIGLIAFVCVALVGSEARQLWGVHTADIRQSEAVTSDTARLMAEQVETTLKTADTIVASLVERVEAEGTGPEARMRLYRLMTSLAAALPAIHEMGISDSQGNAIVESLVPNPVAFDYAAQEYFRFHATQPNRGPFIGAPIKSKMDGSYDITVTRRINGPGGGFAGVVVTSVSMEYFQQLFDQMQAKSGGTIALVADDGTVLARSPANASNATDVVGNSELRQAMRRDQRAGSLSFVSGIDGTRRLGSYHHLGQFPLVTAVAQSEWEVQRGWRAELRSHAIILACVMIVVAVLGGHVVRANRKLTSQAMQDALTGLPNRRFFDATIDREFRRAVRSGQPISVIMIDLDHFKDYNDCYGHLAGDESLRAIARTIQGCLRRVGDCAARYGGEEIAVVLPGLDMRRAYALAETMRWTVRDLAIAHARSAPGIVTFSAGVATWLPGHRASGWQGLVGDADAALYAAKERGRDAVEQYPSPLTTASTTPGMRFPERRTA
jgi:diguanylate cyclase (GGDEF)-like protein